MPILHINSVIYTLFFFFFLLTQRVLALQVTPNSPCASACLDDPSADPSDPNTSNTYSTDIVCSNADYDSTSKGEKFKTCVNCLRNSTWSSSGENDQSWFLYNVRFAVDECIFGFPNSSNALKTPCSMNNACGPLLDSLENGNLVPTNESSYSYCSANQNAFLGTYLPGCVGCLQEVSAQNYLANFLIVLKAGCLQHLDVGTNIGLRGNIFSSNPVNITYPGENSGSSHRKGLTQAAMIGIVAGSVVLICIVIAVMFICYRKKRRTQSMKQLTSPLDPRFGSKSISSPNDGAYGNPFSSSPEKIPPKFETNAFSPKEFSALGLEMANYSKQHPDSRVTRVEGWQDAHAHLEATQGQLQTNSAIPAHPAYIRPPYVLNTPSTSINTTNNYQVPPFASSRSSPKNLPVSIKIPQERASAFKEVQPWRSVSPAPIAQEVERPAQGLQKQRLLPASTVPQIQTALNSHRVSINTQVQAATGLPRAPTPQERQPPQVLPRAATPQQTHLPQFQSQPEMTSQHARPALHSQQPAQQQAQQHAQQHARLYSQHLAQQGAQQADNGSPSRSHSRAGRLKRSGSHRTARESSSERMTAGGWKRSGSRDTSTERRAAPVRISGPMIQHGRRFDFEAAEQDVREREDDIRRGPDTSPESVDNEEQWPGTY